MQLVQVAERRSGLTDLELESGGASYFVPLPDPDQFVADETDYPTTVGLAVADTLLDSRLVASNGATPVADRSQARTFQLHFSLDSKEIRYRLRLEWIDRDGSPHWGASYAEWMAAEEQRRASFFTPGPAWPDDLERHPFRAVVSTVAAILRLVDPPLPVWRFRLEPMPGQSWPSPPPSASFLGDLQGRETMAEARRIWVAYGNSLANQGWKPRIQRGDLWFSKRYERKIRIDSPVAKRK